MAPESIHAGFWKRVFAFIIDIIMLGIVGLLLSISLRNIFLNLGENLWYIGFILMGIYIVTLNSAIGRGQTLGKKLLKIRVVHEGGEFLTLFQSFFRYLIFSLVIFASGIGMSIQSLVGGFQTFVIIFNVLAAFVFFGVIGLLIFNKDKRGLHDYLVKTVVINSKSIDDINVPKIDSFKEAFINHRVAFIVTSVLFILASLAVISAPKLLSGMSFGGVDFDALLDLQYNLEKDFQISNVGVQSQQTTIYEAGGEGVTTQNLIISGHLKYSIFTDENVKAQLYKQINDRVKSTYPNIENYDNVVIEFRSGYNLGIGFFRNAENRVFSPESEFYDHIELARVFWVAGEHQRVVAEGQSALEISTTNEQKSAAHYWIGIGHYRLGNLDVAQQNEETAISLDPNFSGPYVTLGAVMLDRKNTQKAKELAQKAIELDPDFSWAYNLLGLALAEEGYKDQAITQIEEAISVDPKQEKFKQNLEYIKSK